jgi:hypothetical protein
MRGIRRVPSTDDEDEVEVLCGVVVGHLGDRVLAHLRRIADSIESRKVLLDVLGAELRHHHLLEELANRLRLLLVHGRL